MSTTENQTVAAGHSVDPSGWRAAFDELLGRVAGRFGRVEVRRRARAFVLGLLAELPRTNCWTIAEHAGDASPDGMQHRLGRAVWDADRYAMTCAPTSASTSPSTSPSTVGTVPAMTWWSWWLTRPEISRKASRRSGCNASTPAPQARPTTREVGVYLAYATTAGHALIDRELYLPRRWTTNLDRCRAAGIPAQVGFATKPALATAMITRTLDARVAAGWVTGDEVYGADPTLRAALEARRLGYVLAVARDHRMVADGEVYRADALAARVPKRAWQVLSAGRGAKGHPPLRLGVCPPEPCQRP